VVQKLFTNATGPGTATVQNTGQLGHQIYLLLSNAPGHTCVTPLVAGQFEFSFDNSTWTAFGSPVAMAAGFPPFATSLAYTYLASGTFNYVRFNLTGFDNTSCLLSAWYTGSAQPIYLASQGPVPSSMTIGKRQNTGLQFGINPTVSGGIATSAAAAPLVLCDVTSQATVTAGSTAIVVPNSGGINGLNVCAVAVTMATTGTFQFVTGTGAACAGGLTAISPVFNLNAGVPFTLGNGTGTVMSNITGGAGFGAGASNIGGNICVVAVTGNVSVMATYALY
jgi:hypothetical protein